MQYRILTLRVTYECSDRRYGSTISRNASYDLDLYINLRRSRDGAFVRASVACVFRVIHSVRFGQLLRCAHKCTSKGRACLFN